jgi:WhiB family redox-sensing transcriptional regulator
MNEETDPLVAIAYGRDLDWQADARCAGTDLDTFFPEKGGSTKEAKRICRACAVRAECLEYALDLAEKFGIWGGRSERERRRLLKSLDLEAAA